MHLLAFAFTIVFVWTGPKSSSIKMQKRTRPISSHLDRTNLFINKGFYYMAKKGTLFLAGPTQEIPRGPQMPI